MKPVLLALTSLIVVAVVAQDQTKQLLPAQSFKREVPDTRQLTAVLWNKPVIDSIRSLEKRSEKGGLEEALCLYGGWQDGYTLVVMYARTPNKILQQSSTSVGVSCTVTPQFIGIVHTHTSPLRPGSMDGDAYLLRMSEHGLISAAVHGGFLAWVSRELEAAPWKYSEPQLDSLSR